MRKVRLSLRGHDAGSSSQSGRHRTDRRSALGDARLPGLEDLLELGGHGRVAVAAGGLDAAGVGVAGVVVAAELAECVAEAAPGVALVVGECEVAAERVGGVVPAAELLELDGEAEVSAGIVGRSLEHSAE